jgi:hypothetical protein
MTVPSPTHTSFQAMRFRKRLATIPDWQVTSVDFPNKPVMLVNTSPRAPRAQATLKEVFVTMPTNVVC